MATDCATVIARAKALNLLNPSLATNPSEMLSRIRAEQQEVFTRAATINRDFFQTATTLNSSNAASGRSVNLAVLGDTPTFRPVERMLSALLPSGVELSQVDAVDVAAEFAPRFFVRGQSLVEVGSDWGAAGSVTLTLVYAYGMVDLDPAGDPANQALTIPDEWIDLLVLPLGLYFIEKDPGRGPEEAAYLGNALGDWEKLTGRRGAFLEHITNVGGPTFDRFSLPTPRQAGGQ